MVKKIADFIFPVVSLPEDSEVQEKIKLYFAKKEKKKSKDLGWIALLGISILIIDLYFWIGNSTTVINKLLLIIPPSYLFLRGVFLVFCYKREKDCLVAIKQKDKFSIIFFLSLMFALGSTALSLFTINKLITISAQNIFYIIVVGQTSYFTSYLIGYQVHYKRVIEDILKKSKNQSDNDDEINKETIRKGGVYGCTGGFISWMTYKYHIVPVEVLCLVVCVLLGIGLYFLSPIWAECKFCHKTYEKWK